jgi:FlaA1/EpsC-like NDP-sugar epimerase
MTIETAVESSTSAVAVLCGCAEDVAAIANAAPDGVWRKMHLAGVIVPDAEGLETIAGLPVLGNALTREALARLSAPADTAVLCDPTQSRAIASAFLSHACDLGLRAMITSKDRRMNVRRMRISDLLGAAPSSVDWAHTRAMLAGKRILVTGAGGSIGSEICRQLINLWPARLTLLDSSELNLFNIDHELAAKAPDLSRGRALCDIRDADAVARWFKRERPDIVLHVAALKQVPLVEEFAGEGVLTNVLGTRNVAEAAKAHGAHMMLVSTDKAVSPASVMGATKRTAEMLCQAFDRQAPREKNGQRFLIARLGNVLGSAGSVSPLFERQIAAGGPVTITHADVARFFITIPQAAGFLLQALAAGLDKKAPRGVSLVLDMGAPVPVVELARDMIRLKGLRPDVDIQIKYVGLRQGEKLIEQLIDEHETVEPGPSAAIMAARSAPKDLPSLNIEIDRLVMMARAGHDEIVKARLHALVGAERAQAAISF